MSFTVEDFPDLIRILKERPDWRDDLRRQVLSEELLALPSQVAELRVYTEQRFQELAAAQARTEARLETLAQAQARTEARLETLAQAQARTEAKVSELAAAQARTEARLETLAQAQARTEARLEALAQAQVRTEERLETLAQAQARTEARLETLAQAQVRTEERLETLAQAQVQTEVKVTALVDAQALMTTQISGLTQAVQSLTDGVGELKGITTEIEYRNKAYAYFSRVLRRPRLLSSNEIAELLDDAVEAGTLSETEADDVALADIIMRGKQRTDGSEAYLLVEVSWGVGPYDVERAVRRAELLTHLGIPVIPAVAGRRLTAEAAELARAKQVWQILDGATLIPAS
jgi:chromosome segregation ATPase